MIYYLVCASDDTGIRDAQARGWQRIAATRFATPEKDDVRVIRRFADLLPMAAQTVLYKGSDYDDGPEQEVLLDRWLREKEKFDGFIAAGHGRWAVEAPLEAAVADAMSRG